MSFKVICILVVILATIMLLSFKSWDIMLFPKPVNFPAPVYNFDENKLNRETFELGRALFYETALSVDNTISCGSCHIQSSAFTQHGHDLSHGVEDRLGNRNSPPIMNLAWSKNFFWDGGIFHLDLLPVSPITNPVEMDEQMPSVIRKLSAITKYRAMFNRAYGSSEINGTKVFKALSQFMLMCISADSKYDSVMRKQGASFSPEEARGYVLFKKNCNGCHREPLFTDGTFRNNGLDHTFNPDSGRVAITLDPEDRYCFKVPSLRNLSFTRPYMHDGRFDRLEQVIEHYASGVHEMINLDPLLRNKKKPGIAMRGTDKSDLLAFLKTLDDVQFITKKELSEN